MRSVLIILAIVFVSFVVAKVFKSINSKPIEKKITEESKRTDYFEVLKKLNSEEHILDTIEITPIAKIPDSIWSSKFGGNPYWPKNMEFPKNKKTGKELYLLAQLNLSELPESTQLPQTGILQFFLTNDDLMGLEFPSETNPIERIVSDSNGYRVIYHETIEKNKELLRTKFPKDDTYILPISGEYALKFEKSQQKPASGDVNFEKIVTGNIWDFPDEQIDSLYEEFSGVGSRLGGYAYFTQEDPRTFEYSNWKLLFQMDTSDIEGVNIMWGDMGVGNFFIEEENLKNLDFSKVWYNWDCH